MSKNKYGMPPPNGRINMITYNEQIRLQANMLEWMKNMK